jgi:hypothetical protein
MSRQTELGVFAVAMAVGAAIMLSPHAPTQGESAAPPSEVADSAPAPVERPPMMSGVPFSELPPLTTTPRDEWYATWYTAWYAGKKSYDFAVASYEAHHNNKDVSRAMIHLCRISEMLNAGFTDEQVRAWPRINGLLLPSPVCSEDWVAQYQQDIPDIERANAGQVPANPRAINRICRELRRRLDGQQEWLLLAFAPNNATCSGAEMLQMQRRVRALAG